MRSKLLPWIAGAALLLAPSVAAADLESRQAGDNPDEPFPKTTSQSVADEALEGRIERRLHEAASFEDVTIDSEALVVTLRGDVDDDAIRARAERIARRTPGVVDVINRLSISDGRPNRS
jgi:osmotically-inducible protein OsmY